MAEAKNENWWRSKGKIPGNNLPKETINSEGSCKSRGDSLSSPGSLPIVTGRKANAWVIDLGGWVDMVVGAQGSYLLSASIFSVKLKAKVLPESENGGGGVGGLGKEVTE